MKLGIGSDELLTPSFGVRFIGYPAMALVLLAVVLSPFSRLHALGALVMAFGYLSMGVGFVVTVVYYRRLSHAT
jgi:hypothetical protein